jgi:probable rRNA maturation factor
VVRAARRALASEGVRAGRLELVAVDDRSMRRLHRVWMGADSATDVLTFDLSESRENRRRRGAATGGVDGQIIVCAALARRRAASLGVRPRDELSLYVVHGCLHLCGYDDRRRAEAARMHRREDQLLRALGIGPVFATGEAARFDSEHAPRRRRRHR